MKKILPKEVFQIVDETLLSYDNKLSISLLCNIAGVSRAGYYHWKSNEELRYYKEIKDQEDFSIILEAYNYRGYDKGVRGIYMRLIKINKSMNQKKIRRLMRKFNLNCPIRKANPYRRMAKAIKTNNYASNLLNRQFEAYGPRMVLLTDISYIPYNGVFAYLSVIIDAFTKEVLSYQLSDSLQLDFVLLTVEELMKNHKDELKTDTLIHSDQGCHYTSHKFIKIIKDSNLRQSMSRRGNCWDNAPQESFFGHMKDEVKDKISACTTFIQVKEILDDWIDYYNNDRCVWKLNKLSPKEFYESIKSQNANPLGDCTNKD
jgi:transposase InsO family protein